MTGEWRQRIDTVVGDVIHGAWTRVQRYGAVGPRHRWTRSFHSFGDGSMISFPPTVIFGEGRISVGAHTSIGPYASLSAGMPIQADAVGDPIIRIGDRTVLGKGIGIVGHESITIGDDIWTGHYVYITDQNHGYEDVTQPIGTQFWHNDPVVIGDGCWLGHGAIILPGTHLGRNVVVAAGAVVRGTIPAFSVVAGVPAKVVRQYDPERETWLRPGS